MAVIDARLAKKHHRLAAPCHLLKRELTEAVVQNIQADERSERQLRLSAECRGPLGIFQMHGVFDSEHVGTDWLRDVSARWTTRIIADTHKNVMRQVRPGNFAFPVDHEVRWA